MAMRIPVLAYRLMHIDGNDYRSNDLKALAADVRHVTSAGFKVVPASEVIDAWLDGRAHELDRNVVALTTDNGADFNFRDLEHPRWGMQRSVLNILRDFAREEPRAQPRLNVTAFTIASPDARVALDQVCMIGKGWWTESWWREAIASGLLHIGNHSWDYNHEGLPASLRNGWRAGTFLVIDTPERAHHEIRTAAEYLRSHAANPGTRLFAYPYGEPNPFLVNDYFPRRAAELGIRAAFTDRAGFIEHGTGRWELPRFVCGRDWTSTGELQAILDAAADGDRAWVAVQRAAPAPAPDAPVKHEGGLRAFDEFIAARVGPIPGWLHAEAALLTAHLSADQRARGMKGPILEIGVYKGKYLCVLYRLSGPDEAVVGIDLFVDTSDSGADREMVRRNVAAACGESARLKIVVADSMELTPARVRGETGGAIRFASIDGGHTRELVRKDLENTTPLLQPGGIIALDDVFNSGTPGVMEGVAAFFHDTRPALAPFAVCYNKVFVTTPDFHRHYLKCTLDFLDQATWLPTRDRTLQYRRDCEASDFIPRLFGFEVVSFT